MVFFNLTISKHAFFILSMTSLFIEITFSLLFIFSINSGIMDSIFVFSDSTFDMINATICAIFCFKSLPPPYFSSL